MNSEILDIKNKFIKNEQKDRFYKFLLTGSNLENAPSHELTDE